MRAKLGVIVCLASALSCAKLASLESSNGATDPSQRQTEDGPIESPVHLVGDVEITPDTLEFGPVTCGTEATEQIITIVNKTSQTLPYEANLQGGSGFVVRGETKGELPPKGVAKIPVIAQPASANDLRGGILISAGQSYMEVLAHAKGMGAVLEFVPPLADFGEVRIDTTATPIPVELKNTGTAVATVTAAEGKANGLDIAWAPTGTLTIPPGESRTVNAQFIAPSATALGLEATFQPVVSNALCATAPSLRARGSAVTTQVTLSVADFGTQNCNSTTTNKTVTISNYWHRPLRVTDIRLPTPSRFSVATTAVDVPMASGDTPGTATITLSANALGGTPGVTEEDLSMNVSELSPPDGGPRTTRVRIDARGAILTITPARQDFSWNGGTTWKTFAIRNAGNAEISVAYDFVRTLGPAAWYPEKDTHRIGPGATFQIDMGFRPGERGDFEANMTPRRVSGATACTTMPVATSHGER